MVCSKSVRSRLLVVAGVVLAAVGCRRDEPEVSPRNPPPVEAKGPAALAARGADGVLAKMAATYRLRPDRRVTGAAAAVDRMLGAPETTISTGFSDGMWHWSRGDVELGTTDELPDFASMYGVLLASARTSLQAVPAGQRPGGDAVDVDLPAGPREAAGRLKELDRNWTDGTRTVGAVQGAASALCVLALGAVDRLGSADELPSQALGAVALAEALGAPMPRERALLARVLGYQANAQAAAQELPAADPVRLYAGSRRDALASAARRTDANATTVLLGLDLLKRESQNDALRSSIGRLPAAAREQLYVHDLRAELEWGSQGGWTYLVNTFIDLDNARGKARSGNGLGLALGPIGFVLEALQDLGAFERLTGRPMGGILAAIETDLAALRNEGGGPFLPGEILAAYYRGHFTSALNHVAEHYIDALGSKTAAQRFVDELGSGRDETGQQVARYFALRARAQAGPLNTESAAAEVQALSKLGASALARVGSSVNRKNGWDPKRALLPQVLFARADTRTDHRHDMYWIAWASLADIALAEHLARSVVAAAPTEHVGTTRWLAQLDGDRDTLERLLRDPRLTPALRSRALDDLGGTEAVSDATIRALHESLIKEAPRSWRPVSRYGEYLEDERDFGAAREQYEAWLRRPHDVVGLEELAARSSIARTLQREGRLREAWKVIAPLIPSQYGRALSRAALVSSAMGEHDRAIAIAEGAVQRYGSANTVGLLARCNWAAGRPDVAAKLLANPPTKLTQDNWRWIMGPAFGDVFAEDVEGGKRAVAAMTAARIGPRPLSAIGIDLGRQKRHALAFAMNSLLRAPGQGHIAISLTSYAALKRTRGEAEARTWLETQIPPERQGPTPMFAYEDKLWELVWDYGEDPVRGAEHSSYHWLLRAASWIRDGGTNDGWKTRLHEYYGVPSTDFYDVVGRHLVGKTDVDTVWAAVDRPDRQVEAAYFIALRAEHDRDMARAVAWYRAASESTLEREGETQWAYNRLYTLRQRKQSLARLAEDPFLADKPIVAADAGR